MPCGCHDVPLPLYNESPCYENNPLVLPTCENGEECDVVVKDVCVEYTGPNLPCLGIHTHDRLDVIITAIKRAVFELKNCCSCVTASVDIYTKDDYVQLSFDWTFVSGSTYDIKVYLGESNTVVAEATGLSTQVNSVYDGHSFSTNVESGVITDQLYTYEITKHETCGTYTCPSASYTTSF